MTQSAFPAATRRALVFQHMESEGPGLLGALMEARGIDLHVVNFERGETVPDLAPFDLLVVLGGVQDVWQEDLYPWLVAEKAMIREWVSVLQRPYIGICLGHQLLADALGGEVGPTGQMEIGLCAVTANEAGRSGFPFDGLPATCSWMQWHGAEVKRLPSDTEILASSPACAVQAMRVGKRAIGLQFHAEVTATTIETWAQLAGFEPSVTRVHGAGQAEALKADILAGLPAVKPKAEKLFGNLLDSLLAREAVSA